MNYPYLRFSSNNMKLFGGFRMVFKLVYLSIFDFYLIICSGERGIRRRNGNGDGNRVPNRCSTCDTHWMGWCYNLIC